jgi:hypothetical protein
MRRAQQWISIALCALSAAPFGWGQQPISPVIPRGGLLGSYSAPGIPASRLANSVRLRGLIQSGKLYLTAQDAIALAIENNIDIESDRYNALVSVWNYTRQLAGGPLPGVPSGSSQAGSVQNGQGVSGSQTAAAPAPMQRFLRSAQSPRRLILHSKARKFFRTSPTPNPTPRRARFPT